jgi:phosphoglycolate phosphatase
MPLPPDLTGATIAFDLDGTLVETAPDLIGALNIVLGERKLPGLPLEAARSIVGRGARVMIQKGFAAAGAPLDEAELPGLFNRYIDVYLGRIASESRPFPGVERALDDLAAAGARLAVCTNKRTDLTLALLDALEMTGRFDAVVGADLAPATKPDPRHFVHAVEVAGGDPRYALMVGDSFNDVESAKRAGAPVVAVSFGYTETPADQLGADALIHHFDELPGAARKLLSALRGAPGSVIGTPSPADA